MQWFILFLFAGLLSFWGLAWAFRKKRVYGLPMSFMIFTTVFIASLLLLVNIFHSYQRLKTSMIERVLKDELDSLTFLINKSPSTEKLEQEYSAFYEHLKKELWVIKPDGTLENPDYTSKYGNLSSLILVSGEDEITIFNLIKQQRGSHGSFFDYQGENHFVTLEWHPTHQCLYGVVIPADEVFNAKTLLTMPFMKQLLLVFAISFVLMIFVFYFLNSMSKAESEQRLSGQIDFLKKIGMYAGESFLRKGTRELGWLCGARYACLGEVIDKGRKVRLHVNWDRNLLLENVVYDLAGTPCERVLSFHEYSQTTDVQKSFPEDQYFEIMGAVGYWGFALENKEGEVIGILALVHDQPFEKPNIEMWMIDIFLKRLSSELEQLMANQHNLKAQQGLKSSQNRFKSLLGTVAHGVLELDTAGKITYVNTHLERMLLFSEDKLCGSYIWELESTGNVEARKQFFHDLMAETPPAGSFQSFWKRKDLQLLEVEAVWAYRHHFNGEIDGLTIMVKDLSVERNAEMVLANRTMALSTRIKELNCLYSISNLMEDASLTFDKVLNGISALLPMCFSNPSLVSARIIWEEKTYLSPDFHEFDVFQKSDIVLDNQNCGAVEVFCSKSINHSDGFSPSDNDVSLLDEVAKQIGLFFKRRAHAHEIKQLSIALDQSTTMVLITDVKGHIEYANQPFLEVTGYTREEIYGKSPRFLRFHDELKASEQLLWETLIRGDEWRGDFQNRKKSGEKHWVRATISPVRNDEGNVSKLLTVMDDISERKAIEKEKKALESHIRQAQKLETLGTFAGGIAHDFNNILSPILGYTELTRLKTPEESKTITYLDNVLTAAHRARELVQQILTFSRQGEREFTPVQVHLVVKEAVNLIRAWIPSTIGIEQDVDSHTGVVLCDPTQLNQVLMNLCTNAYHAMREGGGRLKISLSRIHASDIPAARGDLEGEVAFLTVEDTGVGMAPDSLERIFEPFYTTKAVGTGTGLGLSVVHGIVKSHGGIILVESRVGVGSIFKIYFPLAHNQTEAKPKALPGLQHGDAKILCVDDEESVTMMLREMLVEFGYDVTLSSNGLDAFRRFQEEAFDLVITDQIMPEMTGSELAAKIHAAQPHFPIILMTGYGGGLVNQNELEAEGLACLQKPVSASDLNKAVGLALKGEIFGETKMSSVKEIY